MMSEIEMSRPEDTLDPALWPLAKGEITVEQMRRKLKLQLRSDEPINPDNLARVNTPTRLTLMKEKTREFTDWLAQQPFKDDNIKKMLDVYDFLAIDWVYSNALDWTGSMADSQIINIKKYVTEKGLGR